MDIQEFIASTIDGILLGVKRAKEVHSGMVAPEIAAESPQMVRAIPGLRQVSNVEFDVAVSVFEKDESKKGAAASIKVLSVFSANGEIGTGNLKELSTVSRIKFSVPICFQHPQENEPN